MARKKPSDPQTERYQAALKAAEEAWYELRRYCLDAPPFVAAMSPYHRSVSRYHASRLLAALALLELETP